MYTWFVVCLFVTIFSTTTCNETKYSDTSKPHDGECGGVKVV